MYQTNFILIGIGQGIGICWNPGIYTKFMTLPFPLVEWSSKFYIMSCRVC